MSPRQSAGRVRFEATPCAAQGKVECFGQRPARECRQLAAGVSELTVRNPEICSSAVMLVLIVTMLVLLSSGLAISWLDRNALR